MPREGPGDDGSTARALDLVQWPAQLARPRVLDMACGPGAQTMALARALDAHITAFDTHRPFLRQLRARRAAEAAPGRIALLQASFFELCFAPETFDLIWCEGAIYIPGFDAGLRACWPLLKPGGCVAVTELSWIRPDPPAEAVEYWREGYPGMRTLEANRQAARQIGYHALGSFVLPDSAWMDGYYTPIEQRLPRLREKYAGNPEALRQLAEHQLEVDIFREYAHWYGYVFIILQKPAP